jgi:hypothetical protein
LGRAAAATQAEVWARKFRRFIEAFLQKNDGKLPGECELNGRWGRLFFKGILSNTKKKTGEVVVNSWRTCGESWWFGWHHFEVKHKADFFRCSQGNWEAACVRSLAPEYVARIELSTWHRYRLAAERTQSSILLLSQYPCAKSSSELQLRLSPAEESDTETTVFAGMQPRIEVVRQRFKQAESNVVPLRKPPQNADTAC